MYARVGRHARTGGRHCQNRPDDQDLMESFLNYLPGIQGGSQGHLNGRKISGICDDDLYQAICRFEDLWFPGQKSGFIDPNGLMYRKMVYLINTSEAGKKKPVVPPVTAPKPPDDEMDVESVIARIKKDLKAPPFITCLPSIITYLLALKGRGVSMTADIAVAFGVFHVRLPFDGNYDADDTFQNARTLRPKSAEQIRTNADGYAVILFSDGSVMLMRGDTTVILFGAMKPRPLQHKTEVVLENGDLARKLEQASKR